ncbi:ABC transporter type 1, transmembrane domain-containing protein [Jimgerdemannia flammicorona]|uniref:ABC transporter type 1, transmembrane domain-containing protein n=1 Tax=Jimgerdemannia flammicorona TaxID=994334 RepID=A0A433DAY4_9FUNG|nr:ABC transporter type 1, transmembrane domain-containing protein [Jimgerdemannia flammicorona]
MYTYTQYPCGYVSKGGLRCASTSTKHASHPLCRAATPLYCMELFVDEGQGQGCAKKLGVLAKNDPTPRHFHRRHRRDHDLEHERRDPLSPLHNRRPRPHRRSHAYDLPSQRPPGPLRHPLSLLGACGRLWRGQNSHFNRYVHFHARADSLCLLHRPIHPGSGPPLSRTSPHSHHQPNSHQSRGDQQPSLYPLLSLDSAADNKIVQGSARLLGPLGRPGLPLARKRARRIFEALGRRGEKAQTKPLTRDFQGFRIALHFAHPMHPHSLDIAVPTTIAAEPAVDFHQQLRQRLPGRLYKHPTTALGGDSGGRWAIPSLGDRFHLQRVLACNFGFVIRAAMIAAIYRKSLRLSPASRQTATVGEITNRMSVDAENFFWSAQSLGLVVATFYQIALALYFLYGQLSWAIFAGLGVILLTFPLNYWIGSSFNKWMKGKMQNMDRRMRLMNEIIGGIKIVKLYAWEKPFVNKVNEAREDEVKFLKQFGQGIAWITVMFTVAPYLVSIACFGVYAGVLADKEHPLDSVRIFVSLSLIQLLNGPLGMLCKCLYLGFRHSTCSQNVSSFMQTYVALNRIRDFLLLEEVDDSAVLHLPYDTTLPSIVLNSASVAWAADAKPTLSDVNLSIARGSLTAVIGRVGSGKTSLISAAIGDMYKQGGTIEIRGSVAYVPQQAWIINATLRENIIFGLAWDESRYRRIIEACCLLADIEMLPGGDMTEIGERGINLSGGQKQRVSLARAVYADADVYLLDDPLSAVDAHVDRALFENVIGPEGLLKEKTRVLVTHGIHHLQNVDEIVALERQRVAECGTYAELMALQGETYKLLVEYSSGPKKEEEEGEAELAEKELDGKVLPVEKEVEPTEEKKLNNGVLVEEERREEGQIGWKVYVTYLKACSLRYVVMFMVVMLLSQGVSVGSRYWLQNWSTQLDAASSIGYYLGIYIFLVFGYAFFSFMTGWILLAVAGIRASRVLHGQLLERVFRLKMSFFDTTPLGRITNRFSKDLSSIDEKIPLMMQNWVFMLTSTISSIIVIGVTTPIFLAIVPPITYAFYWVQSHYLWMSRDLKRLESASRSPIYQHFSETLGGISTIRAYDQSDRFVLENVKRSDANVGAFYLWVSSNRWLQLRVEFLGAFIVLGSAIFACVSRESLSPGLVGLAVSYAMTVTGDVTWLVRSYCDMETNIVSVERIKEYVELPTEAAEVTDFPLAEDWPARGVIEFRNYSTRYREGLELVLKGISFNVAQGEKVGIVGRTGAGKSSLTLSLFRLIEAAGPSSAGVAVAEESVEEKRSDNATLQSHDTDTGTGGIYIDGVEISRLGLTTLRSRLSIIPQDPVLFIGTIRDNLDPFGENDDKALWDALESAHLKEHVGGLEGGLNAPVSQGGENFSVGQRQLICLARALLRKTRILVLDEATSATDVQTDELIQKTIRKEFKDRTILTIAHHIYTYTLVCQSTGITTILDSDKILVLDAGRVAEYDTPDKLLADRSSKFYALAKQTGQNRSAEDITAEDITAE